MRALSCAIVVCVAAVAAHAEPAPPAAQAVTTIAAERKPITQTLDFVGRVEAVDRVEVRARVKGFLEAVLFREGDLISEGAPLYRIEKQQFEADVQQAEGAVARAKASHELAVQQLQRAEELLTKSAGTVVARDQAVAAEQNAKGQMLSDEASLANARINLGYTEIRSPIRGKISRTNITKGNVVSPDSGALTTIVSQDPMYVTFPVSQREFLRARAAGGAANVDVSGIKAHLRFSDGSSYDQTGSIDFVDVTVDRATDTIMARASMPNPKGALVDGQLVRVALDIGSPTEKVLIPQAALIADQQGVYILVVEDGKAAVRRIKPGAASGAGVVVEDGLKGGEQVIVEGIGTLRSGVPVRAQPAAPTPGTG